MSTAVREPARHATHEDRAATGVRTDIQGLRAIAVSIVVAYHVAPKGLRGGFVGVDVFFVISGFLITSHLLAHAPRTGRDLATFWSRRIRRLLPASLLVLATTLVASRLLAPETQWLNTARQARAAALYVVNWTLARDSVDYLAAENAATPVQHFWSLSVEEQFYFVWPIAILLLVALARKTGWRVSAVVGTGLGVVVAASLGYSVYDTATNPPSAYFVTPTRMWELGIGGLLALATAPRVLGRTHPRVPPRLVSAVLAWVGLAAIAWTAWTYSSATPFPGWQALVPVLGTALVIGAYPRPSDRFSPGGLLATPPVQWVGNASYSIYLWHWPMVVLVPFVSHGSIGNLDRLAIVVTTLVLAGLTKSFVEDRFRQPRWGRPLRKPYVLGALGMAIVVGLATLQIAEVQHRDSVAQARLHRALAGNDPCFGAAALDPGRTCSAVSYAKVLPAPVDAADDKSDAYPDVSGTATCWSYTPGYPQVQCTRGDPAGKVRVALLGNSHAGEWLPALEALAKEHGWRIETHLASRCASGDVAQTFDTSADSKACQTWAVKAARSIAASHPDVVVMANRISVPAVGHSFADSQAAYEKGYAAVLRIFHRAGVKVLVLHDSPAPGASIPDCIAQQQDAYASCDGTRAKWLPKEPAATAVRSIADPHIRFLDLTDHICEPVTCHAVTGGVITYFDGSHLTATFARTLAPYLDRPLRQLLKR